MSKRKSSSVLLEPLELRRLLTTWSAYAQLVNQDKAASDFSSLTGSGVTVAVVDTGVDYNQPALGGGIGPGFKVIAGHDFFANDDDPMDESGHGTNVASVIAANPYTVNGITYQGVAPGAKLVALRVGTETNIPDANIDKALQWIITNHDLYHINVVNLSLGAGAYTSAHTEADLSGDFQQLHDLGIFVVAASGNSNDQLSPIDADGIAFPASDPNVFAAGAVDSNDVLTTWGQRGSELDLLAPGSNLEMVKLGGGFTSASGTSFSSPYVAGTAALIKQADPSDMAGDIGSILMSSGHSNRDGDNESGNTTGLLFSRLDIDAALKLTSLRTGHNSTLPGTTAMDTALDSNGVLHAAYYSKTNHDLLYATRDIAGKWSAPQVIDSNGDVGSQLSIAVDSTGKVGIAYYDTTNADLKYAGFDGTSWTIKTIDSNKAVGRSPSLAFDVDGDAYIGYYRKSSGDVKLATLDRDAGTWSTVTVDGATANVGVDVSLACGVATLSNGGFTVYDRTVALAYADSTNGDLKYARLDVDNPSATWYVAVVDNTTGVGNIDLELHDGPSNLGNQAQIAYQDTRKADVKYAFRNGTWTVETVASAGLVGQSVQLAFTAANQPIVSYYYGAKHGIFSATRQVNAAWSVGRTATGTPMMSIAFNDRALESVLTWLNLGQTDLFSRVLA
jgi:subtilisin family serine protease